MRHHLRLRATAGVAVLSAALGATPQSAAMYLRVPSMREAPRVAQLSYDAIATVPAVPNTPPTLLPPDHVLGSITLPAGTRLTAPDFRGVRDFTVVCTRAGGAVVQRTHFLGISITSIDIVGNRDGSPVRRIRFDARSVDVTEP